MHDLKKRLKNELAELKSKGKLGMAEIELIQKITDSIKNIDKIAMLEGDDDDGYAGRRGGMRRGEHYVRAHYSRGRDWDDEEDDYSGRRGQRRDSRGRYSGVDGKDEMIEHLSMAMEASSAEDREAIRRLMNKLERM